MSSPDVSVVIPVRDMEATIGGQLAALSRQDFGGHWEVIVADNGSRDGTAAVVDRWCGRLPLKLVDASGPPDSGHARNAAAAAAGGELLLFCDADDEVRSDWLRRMVDALQECPLVAGALDHSKLNPRALGGTYDADQAGVQWWGFLPAAAGANFGVRRSVFDQLGGFRLGCRRGVDWDFCWRAQLAGHALRLEDAAVVDRRLHAISQWSLFLLHVREGRALVQHYQAFRKDGMPRSPLRDVLYDYAQIPVLVATGRRHQAIRVAGWRVGRLIGSLRCRVLFP